MGTFDRLAGIYRGLERLAFGRDLERARFCWLERLSACRSMLILGEGDGRCLERLVRVAPVAHIHCVDASAAMLTRAARRIAGTEAESRVRFEQADAFEYHVCRHCGLIAEASAPDFAAPVHARLYCRGCRLGGEEHVALVRTPYAFKLLHQELAAMNVAMRFRVR